MKNIGAHHFPFPAEAPVMVLPGVVLLPHTLLPLHIFEPRYREMLAHCLERDRMFCVAMMKPGVTEAAHDDDFFSIGGFGLVRACVAQPDGTSDLVLQGLARVEFTGFVQSEPFRIAHLRALESQIENVVECEALAAKALELCATLKERGLELPPAVQKHLPHLSDPDMLADIIAGAFVREAAERQRLLEALMVSARLRILLKALSAIR